MFSPIASDHIKSQFLSKLSNPSINLDISMDIEKSEQIMIFIATGGTEKVTVDFINSHQLSPPIILLSHDLNNSLPASMEIRTYLNAQGYDARIYHFKLETIAEKLQLLAQLHETRERMRMMKLGLIGGSSEWLIASNIDRDMVNQVWGISFDDIPIEVVSKNLEGQIDKTYFEGASKSYVSELEIMKASSVAAKLESIVQQRNLQGISIKCFDLLSHTDSITACSGLSYLNNKGIIAGCEGDLPSTISMAFLTYLSKKPVFMANITHVDIKSNHIKMAHCTVSTSILESYELLSHFETDKSVGIRGKFKEGMPITICKLFGQDLSDYWVSNGVIIRNITDASACRTQIEIKLEKSVEYFLNDSFANHHIMALGHLDEEIELYFRIFAKR
ncbi:MAG: hypothetical protein INQ03_25140 [Candidatus Heimdallarchaeota archaeon]|nr:hypothetical protein [Candidatus Heimdallarchaeota archaeon]